MSRVLLRRLAVLVWAYALALQPIIAASLLELPHDSQVFCSGTADGGAPPVGHGPDVACCLSACCAGLSAVVAQRATLVRLSGRIRTAITEPQAFVPAQERYPRSRAPPA
jgi:hypothetical protein